MRPMLRSGRGFWLLAGLLGVPAAVGLAAWGIQLMRGLGVAGYTDRAFWAIYEANLVAFIGVSYGGALVSAILRLTGARWRAPITRIAEATALFSLLVGMSFAMIHLGRPERIWEMVTRPHLSSIVIWDFVAITTYLVATAIFLYLPLIPDLAITRARLALPASSWSARIYAALSRGWLGQPGQHRILERATNAMAVLIIPLAVSVHSVLSWAFSLTSRPGWHSSIFAPYFVVGALYSGVALVILVTAGFRRGYRLYAHIRDEHFVRLGYLLLVLVALYLYFTFSELLTEGYVMQRDAVELLTQLLGGQYAIPFWLFVVVGGIVPLLLVSLPQTRTVWGIVTASACAVFGMWLKRMLIVVPAATAPLISGAWGHYRFTWVATAVTLGAAAAIPLLLMVFFRFVPVLSIAEMEELAEGPPVALPPAAEPVWGGEMGAP